MAGDGSAVKSKPSNTPTVGAAELLKITHSASAMKQNSRWRRVRDKVEVRRRKTEDTVHSTLSFFKKSKKSKSKSVFSEELKWAKLSRSCNQSIWKLSLQRRRSSSKSFTLDSVRATKQFKGWGKSSRPIQNCLKNRGTTRKVGPKMSARRKEVIAWCESIMLSKSCHKSKKRAADFLAQQEMRGICHEVSSVALLASVTISFNIIRSWQQPLDQELNVDVEGVSSILVGANEFQMETIDSTEECTPEFHLIWLEMMAEQPNIQRFGVPRMQNMSTGAHWGMCEGLQSLMGVVKVMDGPNTEGFDQIRSKGAPMRNSDFASNGHLKPKISEYGNQFKQGACQSTQSSALRKGSPEVQDMEGQAPVVSITLGIDQKLKMPIYPEFCSERNVVLRTILRDSHAKSSRQRSGFVLGFHGGGNSANSKSEHVSRNFQVDSRDLRHEFEASKWTYREEYGFSSNNNQDESVRDLIKGPNGGHTNHSALSGEQYIDGQGVAGLGQNGTIEAPKVAHSEEAGPMDNSNDEELIGNIIRGTNASQLGHSE